MLDFFSFMIGNLFSKYILTSLEILLQKMKIHAKLISLIGLILLTTIPTIWNKTIGNSIENIIKTNKEKYDIFNKIQKTDDHIFITPRYHIFLQDTVLDLLKKYGNEIEVITILSNEKKSSTLFLNSSDIMQNVNSTGIDEQKKKEKIRTSILRSEQVDKLLKYKNFKIINFYTKEYEQDFKFKTNDNIIYSKSLETLVQYGIYTIVYFKETKKILYFIEIGGYQVQNHSKNTRNSLVTLLYYSTEPQDASNLFNNEVIYNFNKDVQQELKKAISPYIAI